ncbi:MAG TPA: ferritin family protein [Candidatus Deferrimicrobium sp.]|nr:ferritin family protein [Candidatus Deferrimicrobium sp.]
MKLDTVDKILEFAIAKEEDAARFYRDLAVKMQLKHMKEVFLGFAREEDGHKEKLLGVKSGKRLHSAEKTVQDLQIGDHLVDIDLRSDLGYQEALIVAMKAEKAAFKLYTELAQATADAGLKQLFLSLAQEEAKHKLRFEIEYDDYVMTEN